MAISDDPRRFQAGSELLRDDGRLIVESVRPHGTRLLVKFEGVDTRDDAKSLRGPLFVPADDARTLEHDEYWPHDVIGCEVFSLSDDRIGVVADLVAGAAQDLLIVTTEAGERMVPFVKEIVRQVDVAAHRIVIDPPAGLLD